MPSWKSSAKALQGCRGYGASLELPHRVPTLARPSAPGPGGHPAPSGHSPGTRLRAGSGGWNRGEARLHSSILGPGSTLQTAVHFLFENTGERKSERSSVGSMEGRTQSSGEGRRGAVASTTAARLAMVGTLPRGPDRPHRLWLQHHLGRASPCRPPCAHCLAHSPSAPSPSGLSAPHLYLHQWTPRFLPVGTPVGTPVVGLRFPPFLISPPPPSPAVKNHLREGVKTRLSLSSVAERLDLCKF